MSRSYILLLSCFLSQCLGSCLDTKEDCSTRAKDYDCLRVPEQMSCSCPQSCNTLSECSDTPGELHCECLVWVQEGRCDSDSKYMKEHCHETCTIWRSDTCPAPPSRANMVVNIVRGSGMRYSDVISYSCDEGYTDTSVTPSAQGMLVCDGSYQWQSHGVYGDLPTCVTEDGGSTVTQFFSFQMPAAILEHKPASFSTTAAAPDAASSTTSATTSTTSAPDATSSTPGIITTSTAAAPDPASSTTNTITTSTTSAPDAASSTTSATTSTTAVHASVATNRTGFTTPPPSVTTLSVLRSMFASSLNECLAIDNSFKNMGTTRAVMKMLTTVFGNNLLFCIRMCGMVPTCSDVQYLHGNCTLYTQIGGDQLVMASTWRKFSS